MAHHEYNSYRFPWRSENRFQLWVDGCEFFPAMLQAIRGAQHFVALEMYLIDSGHIMDQFIDALIDVAQRDVDVFLLFDDFGARGLNKQDRNRLKQANIQLKFYNPLHYGKLRRLLFRDHRKLLIVDNRSAFIGGAGISDRFSEGGNTTLNWHDIMLEVSGECVDDWYDLFIDNWPGTIDMEVDAPTPNLTSHQPPPSQLGRVTVSQMSTRKEIQRSLIKQIRNAEHWVWITTAYFVPSWKVRRALKKAAKRGVDVRLMLPGKHTDHPAVRHAGRRFYYGLLRHGVRIYEFLPRFNHGKAYVCDYWCSVGSSNLDRWNLIWNLEGNQEVDDQDFTSDLKSVFESDLKHCHEITYHHWQRRPWHRRTLEWFWGRVDVWLVHLGQRWHSHKRKR